MEKYTESGWIRPTCIALASIIPGIGAAASAVDDVIKTRVERERWERLNTLVEELERGLEDFAGPIPIERADIVLHAAYATIEATLRTSRRQKIRAFARLLAAGLEEPSRLDLANEHEDYLKILDDLSTRELGILSTLAVFEKGSAAEVDNDLKRTNAYWDEFTQEVCDRFGIPQDELSGLLARLTRTGMYELIVGTYFGYEGGQGKLTGTYYRLESLIQASPGMFDSGQIV